MNVIPFRAEHMAQIDGGLHWIGPELAASMEGKFSISGTVDGKVVACAGATEVWSGRFLMWAYIDRSTRHWKSVHRAAKNFVGVVSSEARRLEANVPCDFEPGRRWVEHLGFRLEIDRMPKYLPNGRDAAMYVIVKEG